MFLETENENIKLLLTDTSSDANELRDNLRIVLNRAGIEVVSIEQNGSNHTTSMLNRLDNAIQNTNCSVHILGATYKPLLDSTPEQSITEFQFTKAREYNLKVDNNYKVFIWQPDFMKKNKFEPRQERFVNSVRNSIYQNMIFSNVDSSVMLVEDIRSIMQISKNEDYTLKESEVFLIYNELDEDEAVEIVDLLADIVKVESLCIDLSSQVDYLSLVPKQLGYSKLGVIYFKRTSAWALPFTQQVWKNTGGASATTPLLLIGDGSNSVNEGKIFNAPNVISQIIPTDLIPLEIKVQFDNLLQK